MIGTVQRRDQQFLSEIRPAFARPLANVVRADTILFAPGPGLGLGDQCMCVPLVHALKCRFPGARISMLTQHPDFWRWQAIDGVTPIVHGEGEPGKIVDILGSFDLTIAGYHPDCLDALARSGKHVVFSAGEQLTFFRCFYADRDRCWEVPLLTCKTAVGEALKFRSLFVDIGVCADMNEPVAHGWPGGPVTRRRPSGRPRVLIHPGAGKPYKAWPLQRWQDLANDLASDGVSVSVSAGASRNEADLARALRSAAPRSEILPQLPLESFVARLDDFDLVLSGDTALPHLVARCGAPLSLAIFGPTDPLRFCPPSAACFFVSPFAIARDDARHGVEACLALASGDTDRLAAHGQADALHRAASLLRAAVTEFERVGEGDATNGEIELLARDYRGRVRPEFRTMMAGEPAQFNRVTVLLRHREPALGRQYLMLSAAYRSARWLASRE